MEAERIAEHYLDGAQRAVKSRVEFTSWLTFSTRDCVTIYDGVGFANRCGRAATRSGDIIQEGWARSLRGGKGAAAAKTHGGEVFAEVWWSCEPALTNRPPRNEPL